MPGLTEGAAQVSQDGVGLVQREVSVLELGELPVQLGGRTALSEVLGSAAPHPSVAPTRPHKVRPLSGGRDRSTHAGSLEGALQPGLHGHHLLLPALVLVSQQHAHGLAAPWGRGGRGSEGAGQGPRGWGLLGRPQSRRCRGQPGPRGLGYASPGSSRAQEGGSS